MGGIQSSDESRGQLNELFYHVMTF